MILEEALASAAQSICTWSGKCSSVKMHLVGAQQSAVHVAQQHGSRSACSIDDGWAYGLRRRKRPAACETTQTSEEEYVAAGCLIWLGFIRLMAMQHRNLHRDSEQMPAHDACGRVQEQQTNSPEDGIGAADAAAGAVVPVLPAAAATSGVLSVPEPSSLSFTLMPDAFGVSACAVKTQKVPGLWREHTLWQCGVTKSNGLDARRPEHFQTR